jgi:hypothetical protein
MNPTRLLPIGVCVTVRVLVDQQRVRSAREHGAGGVKRTLDSPL